MHDAAVIVAGTEVAHFFICHFFEIMLGTLSNIVPIDSNVFISIIRRVHVIEAKGCKTIDIEFLIILDE